MKGVSQSYTDFGSWFHRQIAWGKENWCALECTAGCTRRWVSSSWGWELVFPQEEHWPRGRISVHSSSEIRNGVLIASFCLQGWGYHIFQSRLPKLTLISYCAKKWVIKLLLRPLLPKVDIESIIICYLLSCCTPSKSPSSSVFGGADLFLHVSARLKFEFLSGGP